MARQARRRWTAAAALAFAGLTLILWGSAPPPFGGSAATPRSDAEVSRPWALLEQTLVTVRPQAPGAVWSDRASSRSFLQAAGIVVAGIPACMALAWSPFCGTLPGLPALRRRRYTVARRAPPPLALAKRP